MADATTTEYPTRYAAHVQPRTLVEYTGPQVGDGKATECAVYWDMHTNPCYPAVQDGVYSELRSMPQGKPYLVEVQASLMDMTRGQWNKHERCATYPEALAAMRRLITEGNLFVYGQETPPDLSRWARDLTQVALTTPPCRTENSGIERRRSSQRHHLERALARGAESVVLDNLAVFTWYEAEARDEAFTDDTKPRTLPDIAAHWSRWRGMTVSVAERRSLLRKYGYVGTDPVDGAVYLGIVSFERLADADRRTEEWRAANGSPKPSSPLGRGYFMDCIRGKV